MTWDEFESIIDSTTIELYSTEWHDLKKEIGRAHV